MGKNSEKTTAIRESNIQKILKVAGAPNAGIPVPGYQDNSLTQAGQSIGKAIKQSRESMGGSAGRTEDPYQAQRAGEREDLTRFGDNNEHLGIMGNSMGGSKKFNKKEVKRGYRKI